MNQAERVEYWKQVSRVYHEGVNARRENEPKGACQYGFDKAEWRSWWLAGWHDADNGKVETQNHG